MASAAVMGIIGGAVAANSASKANKTAKHASERGLGYKTRALEYMMDSEELPQQYREEALSKLGGIFAGSHSAQQDVINRATQSPLYASIMGGREAGEESIMRNASMTGGLRSGNVQENLYDYSTTLQNQALLQSYNQQLSGLQGLAGLPSNANNIASQYNQMGDSSAEYTMAKGQTRQAGNEAIMSGIYGGAKMGAGAYDFLR